MRQAVAFLALLVVVDVAHAQSSYPMLMDVSPLAVQAGASAEHVVSARYNLLGTFQVIVDGEGVIGEPIAEPKKDEPKKPDAKKDDKAAAAKDTKPAEPVKKPEQPKHKIRFTAAAGAEPGVREFRLVTPQ